MPSGWKRITWCPMAENRRTITCVALSLAGSLAADSACGVAA